MSDHQADARTIVVLGNPENRRVRMFCEAARQLGLPQPSVIAYEDILAGRIDPRQAISPGNVVRIESPGENEVVHRGLIALGAAARDSQGEPGCDPAAPIQFGEIAHQRLWYQGFWQLLSDWERLFDPLPVFWMNHPADIRLMFRKTACQRRLHSRGIPVPPILGAVNSYEDLRARMREAGVRSVFVKPQHGSSASGVVALRVSGARARAITSVEMSHADERLRLFNSLKVREYRDERQAALLIDALGPSGLHVERWIPKASCQGGVFDLRVVTIAGEPRHMVMRIAQHPLTNLHLGNERGDAAAFMASLPQANREAAMETCRRVARLFPRSLCLGIDLMFSSSFRRHYVLEINAFGDLLPRVIHDGADTYTAELQALIRPDAAAR